MWPDLWIAFVALAAALAAITFGRWLARAARRLEQQGRARETVRPARVGTVGERAVPVASRTPIERLEDRPPPIAKRRRRLTRRTARDGVVLATILGPCRGLRMQEHDL